MEALGNKMRSYLDWIEFTTKVNYTLRIENQVSGILWCFFAFSVLLMLLKGFSLIKGYVVFKDEKPKKGKGWYTATARLKEICIMQLPMKSSFKNC